MLRISLLGCLVVLMIGLAIPSAVAINKVLYLDGDGDYVEVQDSDSLDLTTEMTVEMWVSVTSLVGNDVDIFVNKEDAYECGITSATHYYTMPQQNFAFALSINGGWVSPKNAGWYDGGQRLDLRKWYHVAITYDGELAKAYVDGILTASYTVTGSIDTRNSTLRIGARSWGAFLNGFIDEVRIWNVARTQTEIQETMNRPLTLDEIQSENLVGYWNFDSGYPNDLSQYHNYGQLKGNAHIADVIYVSVDGDDINGDGTIDNPYRTIQKGIDESGRKDIVQVLPGVYEENISLLSDLIVLGSGAEDTTITSDNGNIVTAHNTYNVSISGFTIDGQGSADNGILCSGTSSEVEIKANVITGAVKGIQCLDSASPLIEDNVIQKNSNKGIDCSGSSNPTIRDNKIPRNGEFGVACYGTSTATISYNSIGTNYNGIACSDSAKTNITHNIVRDSTHGIGVWAVDGSITVIKENIISKNIRGIHLNVSTSPVVTISGNIIEGNGHGIDCINNANPLIGGNLIDTNSITNNSWGVYHNTANIINATYNYWGTTDEAEIAAMMRNEGDGSIIFKPFINTLDEIIADPSGDGTISALDAALILQYVVGLINEFPATSPIGQAAQKYIAGEITVEELDKILQQWGYPSVFKLLGYENKLLQNYPNPFNPETWIPFKLANASVVNISIYDTKGQLIRTIALGNRTAGIYTTKDKSGYWDGKDRLGQSVSSGVYYYTLQAGEYRATRRMVVVK